MMISAKIYHGTILYTLSCRRRRTWTRWR